MTDESAKAPEDPERLGIVGSGAIACGLAAVAARCGAVVLCARSQGSAERAAARVAKLCGDDGLPDHVQITCNREALAGATFVVESIVEDRDAKAGLLAELEGAAGEGAILATTTSSLSIEDLAAATGHPERFAGLHVFNPVTKMDLVEVVFPAAATEGTRARTLALCDQLGKTAIEVPDLPGFVVNRLLFPFLFEAVRLLDETGLEPEAVDACLQLGAGHPMGPLALLDFVGLDVAVAIGESIDADVPARVRALVDAGRLGRKSGSGFFEYG